MLDTTTLIYNEVKEIKKDVKELRKDVNELKNNPIILMSNKKFITVIAIVISSLFGVQLM